MHEIQDQVAQWEEKNCPDMTAEDKLIGIMEELGELAHANFKGRLLGRDTREQEVDAVGDIVIFLMGYCNKREINLCHTVGMVWGKVQRRDNIKGKQ